MLIILEGPDGAGKTTLANALSEKLGGVEIRHCGPLTQPPLDEYVRDLYDYYVRGTGDIIYDRHYMGELIYGPLYRGKSQIDFPTRYAIETFLNMCGALLVHVTNDLKTLRKRCELRGEDFLKPEDIEHVRAMYYEEMLHAQVRFKITTTGTDKDTVEDILWLASNMEYKLRRKQ